MMGLVFDEQKLKDALMMALVVNYQRVK